MAIKKYKITKKVKEIDAFLSNSEKMADNLAKVLLLVKINYLQYGIITGDVKQIMNDVLNEYNKSIRH